MYRVRGFLSGTGEVTGYANGLHLASIPNPLHSTAQISFELSRQGHVFLCVYDQVGRIMDQVLDEHGAVGKHTVSWEAAHLESGVYFVTIDVDGKRETCQAVRFSR